MRVLTIAVVLLLALAGAGCGGGDDETAADTDTVTETTTNETTTDGSEVFGDDECAELVAAYTALGNAFAAAGGTDADSEEVQGLLERFAGEAPAEIRDDIQVLAEAYAQYAEALGEIDLEPNEIPDAEDLAKIQAAVSSLNQAEITEASQNVSQWTTENC